MFFTDVFSSRSADASKPLNDLYNAEKEATPSTNREGKVEIRYLKSDIKLTDKLSKMVVPIYTRLRLLKVVPRGRGPIPCNK